MTELFTQQLLPAVLKAGISINDFWEYDLSELLLIVSTYNEQRQEEAKERLACNYSIAALTASFVNKALNGKKLPSLGEMYPDIFAEDDARATALKFAADFKQFALKHNKGDK